MQMLLHLMVSLNSPIIFHLYHNAFSLLFGLIVFRHSVFRITDPSACARLLCVPRNVFLAHFPVFQFSTDRNKEEGEKGKLDRHGDEHTNLPPAPSPTPCLIADYVGMPVAGWVPGGMLRVCCDYWIHGDQHLSCGRAVPWRSCRALWSMALS